MVETDEVHVCLKFNVKPVRFWLLDVLNDRMKMPEKNTL